MERVPINAPQGPLGLIFAPESTVLKMVREASPLFGRVEVGWTLVGVDREDVSHIERPPPGGRGPKLEPPLSSRRRSPIVYKYIAAFLACVVPGLAVCYFYGARRATKLASASHPAR